MSGRSAFEDLIKTLTNPTVSSEPYKKITQAEFESWQAQASFDIIKGARYGQSFCNHFGITDNILYYEFSWLNADEYIRRAYIEKF
jgi:hypothetical protein